MLDLQCKSKINVLVGAERETIWKTLFGYHVADKAYVILSDIETGLHFTKYEPVLNSLIDISRSRPVMFSTQSKEILEVLVGLLRKRPEIKDEVSVYNIYKNKQNDVAYVRLDQEAFIHNVENNNEIRD